MASTNKTDVVSPINNDNNHDDKANAEDEKARQPVTRDWKKIFAKAAEKQKKRSDNSTEENQPEESEAKQTAAPEPNSQTSVFHDA